MHTFEVLFLVIAVTSFLVIIIKLTEKEDGINEVVKNKEEEKKEEVANNEVENKKGYSSKAKLLFGFGIVAFFVVIFKADDWIYSARKVASYDWGYECGYKSSYLYWEDWIESDRKTNFICGENKKYEYWGSAKWREGYRDGEVDGKKAYLRGNKKFCGSLPCDKEGAMQPTIDALTR
tara:strand:+ start:69 stop:602 length:534 start_codon:yes stop_codon:yes gene_type:complete